MDLEKILTDKGLRKSQLAKHMDVAWATVNNWCKNPNGLSLDKVEDIGDFVGLSLIEMIEYGK